MDFKAADGFGVDVVFVELFPSHVHSRPSAFVEAMARVATRSSDAEAIRRASNTAEARAVLEAIQSPWANSLHAEQLQVS